MAKPLYLIALVPNPELREKVRKLKEEMKDLYGASHALKSPAHITLQMPFRHPEEEESRLLKCLLDFAELQEAFEVRLSGFDCFPPRVLFLRVLEHVPIVGLRHRLKELLQNDLGFPPEDKTRPFHPHMTIATRDLHEDMFRRAWTEFKQRKFEARFSARHLFLLKHNGIRWEVFREFPFKGQISP